MDSPEKGRSFVFVFSFCWIPNWPRPPASPFHLKTSDLKHEAAVPSLGPAFPLGKAARTVYWKPVLSTVAMRFRGEKNTNIFYVMNFTYLFPFSQFFPAFN